MSSSQGYAAVPNWLVDDTSFSFQAKLVYMVFARHVDRYGAAYPGVKYIAEKAGISESAVKRAKKELVAAGLLVLIEERRYGGSQSAPLSSVYKVLTSLPTPTTSGQPDLRSELSTGQGDLRSVGAEVTGTPDLGSGRPLKEPQGNNPRGKTRGGENVPTSPGTPVDNFSPPQPLARPERCVDHQDDPYPPPCGRCKDARQHVEELEREAAHDPTLIRKCEHNHVAASCPYCPGGRLYALEDVG